MMALYPQNFLVFFNSVGISVDVTEDASLRDELLGTESYYLMGTYQNAAARQTSRFDLDIEFFEVK